MKSWQEYLYLVCIGIVVVYLSVEVVLLKIMFAELKQTQAKPAFYLVHSVSGKHLKLEKIK